MFGNFVSGIWIQKRSSTPNQAGYTASNFSALQLLNFISAL
jgi:hypothetical protein